MLLIISDHTILDQIILHSLHKPNRAEALPDYLPIPCIRGQDTAQEHTWDPVSNNLHPE